VECCHTSKAVNPRRDGTLIGEISRDSTLVLCICSANESRVKDESVLWCVRPSFQRSLRRQTNTNKTNHVQSYANVQTMFNVNIYSTKAVRKLQSGYPLLFNIDFTWLFHDQKKWKSMTYRHNIYLQVNDIRLMNAYQN